MKRIILAGAAFAALSTAAFAADMPIAAPEAVIEPVDIWSGYYVGIQGGFAFGEFDDESVDGGTFDMEGAFGGLYYGRNWQFGSWVLGLDGSVSVADITSEDGYDPDEFKIQGFSASRARVGYAFDNVLLFAAGGFSLARAELDAELDIDGFGDDDAWLTGFTVGAGLEAKFAENWSARLEYMYFNWGDKDFDIGDLGEVTVNPEDTHVVRGGIAYHF